MWLRILTAAAVVTSAWVHLDLWRNGYRDIDVIGPAFMLNAVAGGVIGILLVVWRHWLPLFAAVGFGASTLGAFVVSASVGLFGVQESWTGGDVLTAAASEVVAIVAGGYGLWRERPRRSAGQPQERPSAAVPHLD